MNSAHQFETVEISDADLDNVSGGLNPSAGLTVGPASVSSADVLAQVDAVKNDVLGTVEGTLGQYAHVCVNVSV
ncbi:hypothetical protein ACWD4G_36335 [Streptomyces sp. NPDC002643]